MVLGIRPTVDFAFKKIFGSPENSASLIGLLNAILCLNRPIVAVEILNPFNYQEFAERKLIVLDVRCRDSTGRVLNVEMQVSAYAGLIERLVYYACSMYVDQIAVGGNYAMAAPSISICLLNHRLFPGSRQAQTLRKLLAGIEFETAIETIEIISAKTEDKQMYDQREQAQRDYEWTLSGAREEGREEGLEAGREEGRKLAIIDTVQMLQELLGEPTTAQSALTTQSLDALMNQVAELQQRLRDRQA